MKHAFNHKGAFDMLSVKLSSLLVIRMIVKTNASVLTKIAGTRRVAT